MRKILIISLLAVLSSCEEKTGYSISGKIDNVADGQKLYVSELNENDNQTTPIDTVEVVDGNFELELPEKGNPTISFLSIEGVRGNVLFIADNTPIEFEVYKDSLFASKVSGGEDNKVLYNYLEKIKKTNKKMSELQGPMMAAYSNQDTAGLKKLQNDQQEIAENDKQDKIDLVEENPNSIVSVMVLQDMSNSQMFSSTELKELFEGLSADIKNTHLGKTLNQSLSNLSMVDVGSKAPDFSAPTPEGKELALNDVLGKLTLVDFWASWCKPCRVENPNIVRVYEKYHEKGFNILGVSLDRPGQKEKWEAAIAEDKLTWDQVSNLKFWEDPIVQQYGIRAIPAAFLLDENGVIIAKDLRGKALENKVSEILGTE